MVKILYLYLKYISRNRKISKPAYWEPWKKKLPVFKRLKNVVEVETLEKELLGKKVEMLKFQKQKKFL